MQHGLRELLDDSGPDLAGAWHDGYLAVNAAFAEAVLGELERTPEAAVLFQDYHLYAAPVLVRARRPQARLAHFVHIPWVGPEAWAALPSVIARAAHDGLLACDSVGFHAERWRTAFVDSAAALLGRGDEAHALTHVNPVAVDEAGLREVASRSDTIDRERALVADRPERLILRVDRTDPRRTRLPASRPSAACCSGAPTCAAGSACWRCSIRRGRASPSTRPTVARSKRRPRP